MDTLGTTETSGYMEVFPPFPAHKEVGIELQPLFVLLDCTVLHLAPPPNLFPPANSPICRSRASVLMRRAEQGKVIFGMPGVTSTPKGCVV